MRYISLSLFIFIYLLLMFCFKTRLVQSVSRKRFIISVVLTILLYGVCSYCFANIGYVGKVDIFCYLFCILMNLFAFLLLYNNRVLDVNCLLKIKREIYLFCVIEVFFSLGVVYLVDKILKTYNNFLVQLIFPIIISVLIYLFLRRKLPILLVEKDLRWEFWSFIGIVALSGIQIAISMFLSVLLIYSLNKYLFKILK